VTHCRPPLKCHVLFEWSLKLSSIAFSIMNRQTFGRLDDKKTKVVRKIILERKMKNDVDLHLSQQIRHKKTFQKANYKL